MKGVHNDRDSFEANGEIGVEGTAGKIVDFHIHSVLVTVVLGGKESSQASVI